MINNNKSLYVNKIIILLMEYVFHLVKIKNGQINLKNLFVLMVPLELRKDFACNQNKTLITLKLLRTFNVMKVIMRFRNNV